MKKNFQFSIFNFQKGFTLFVALVVTGTLLLIAAGVVSLAVKQSFISASGRESQRAFYAADTGLECALYWDVKNPSGQSAFATSTGSTIFCNKDANNPGNQWVVGGAYTSVINRINFLPDPYCAIVVVTKGVGGSTKIESLGYNTCDSSNPRRVERAVRATYGGEPPAEEFTFTVSPSSVERGSSVTVSWTGLNSLAGQPAANDWLGLYPPGVNDFGYIANLYAGTCTTTQGSAPGSSGSCSITVPSNAVPSSGYRINLFEGQPPSNGLASTPTFTVTSSPPVSFTATGGTITQSGAYTIHKFTSSGIFQVTSGSADLDVLVVAGGGAGGPGSDPWVGYLGRESSISGVLRSMWQVGMVGLKETPLRQPQTQGTAEMGLGLPMERMAAREL